VRTAKFLIEQNSDNEELDEAQREMVRQQDLKRLEAMTAYCKTDQCLRGYILEYFGQKHSEVCGNCGSCKGEFEEVDVTVKAQMLMSCIVRIHDHLGYWVGVNTVAGVLLGRKDKKLLEQGLNRLSTYGLMKSSGITAVKKLADHLEAEGYLVTEQEHYTLRLTPEASEVLYRGKTLTMKQRKEQEEPPKASPSAQSVVHLSEEDRELYDILRDLRMELAKKSGVPPYVVFSNAVLMNMAAQKPKTMSQFRGISGVGELKASWYGEIFTRTIRNYLEEQ